MWYRVTRTDESKSYTQLDYRRQGDAVRRIEKWTKETITALEGNKVTMTIEIIP